MPKKLLPLRVKTRRLSIVLPLVGGMAAWSACAHEVVVAAPSTDTIYGFQVIDDDTELIPSSSELSDAYGVAQRLSEENPSDFGFPLLTESGVSLPVTSASSRPLLDVSDESLSDSLRAYDVRRESRTSGEIEVSKTLSTTSQEVLHAFSKYISTTPGEITRSEVEKTKNGVFDITVSDPFRDEAKPTGAGINHSTGKVILTVEVLSSNLAEAIAASFDKDLITIHFAKRPEDARLLSGGRQADPRFTAAHSFILPGLRAHLVSLGLARGQHRC